jgi:tetratricopeptide (TPR) repeat protein
MRFKFYILVLAVSAFGWNNYAQAQAAKPASQTARSITVVTEPNAIVWIDDIRRGATDASGKLVIKTVPGGVRKLRVRADGFKEAAQALTAAQKGEVKVALVKTTDESELAFQQAEASAASDREKSVELYRKAFKLRPKFAEAQLGLARVLLDNSDNEEALKAIREARKIKPVYPEASAVEGRIYRSEGDDEKAIVAFKRAIREGKGFQPEAHTGLGLLYKERAEGFGSSGDLEQEKINYDLAAASLKTALQQLSGAPDAEVIYQMLGVSYEKQHKYAEAIKIYEEFLRVFPDSTEASAVRSFIVQAQKQMKEQ